MRVLIALFVTLTIGELRAQLYTDTGIVADIYAIKFGIRPDVQRLSHWGIEGAFSETLRKFRTDQIDLYGVIDEINTMKLSYDPNYSPNLGGKEYKNAQNWTQTDILEHYNNLHNAYCSVLQIRRIDKDTNFLNRLRDLYTGRTTIDKIKAEFQGLIDKGNRPEGIECQRYTYKKYSKVMDSPDDFDFSDLVYKDIDYINNPLNHYGKFKNNDYCQSGQGKYIWELAEVEAIETKKVIDGMNACISKVSNHQKFPCLKIELQMKRKMRQCNFQYSKSPGKDAEEDKLRAQCLAKAQTDADEQMRLKVCGYNSNWAGNVHMTRMLAGFKFDQAETPGRFYTNYPNKTARESSQYFSKPENEIHWEFYTCLSEVFERSELQRKLTKKRKQIDKTCSDNGTHNGQCERQKCHFRFKMDEITKDFSYFANKIEERDLGMRKRVTLPAQKQLKGTGINAIAFTEFTFNVNLDGTITMPSLHVTLEKNGMPERGIATMVTKMPKLDENKNLVWADASQGQLEFEDIPLAILTYSGDRPKRINVFGTCPRYDVNKQLKRYQNKFNNVLSEFMYQFSVAGCMGENGPDNNLATCDQSQFSQISSNVTTNSKGILAEVDMWLRGYSALSQDQISSINNYFSNLGQPALDPSKVGQGVHEQYPLCVDVYPDVATIFSSELPKEDMELAKGAGEALEKQMAIYRLGSTNERIDAIKQIEKQLTDGHLLLNDRWRMDKIGQLYRETKDYEENGNVPSPTMYEKILNEIESLKKFHDGLKTIYCDILNVDVDMTDQWFKQKVDQAATDQFRTEQKREDLLLGFKSDFERIIVQDADKDYWYKNRKRCRE